MEHLGTEADMERRADRGESVFFIRGDGRATFVHCGLEMSSREPKVLFYQAFKMTEPSMELCGDLEGKPAGLLPFHCCRRTYEMLVEMGVVCAVH